MNCLHVPLQTTPVQHGQMVQLQSAFAAVCNALAPLVQRTGCWNRVALHHLAYRPLRLQFPAMGSQMICNALYSVSRASRLVYQHPRSPFHLQRLQGRPLPRLHFLPASPVYFDRHTLSLKNGQASMYTLDGRMRFNLPLSPQDELRFRTARLREIVLRSRGDQFFLSFSFGELSGDDADAAVAGIPDPMHDASDATADRPAVPPSDVTPADPYPEPGPGELPQYLLVLDEPVAEASEPTATLPTSTRPRRTAAPAGTA